MGFAAAGLAMFYFSYRYMLLFTVQAKIDTKGHSYTLALQQMLTGVYLAELCLLGLFGLRKATGPFIMMVVLLILTILYNVATNRYLAPLEKYLPTDLATESDDGDEITPLLSATEQGEGHMHQRVHHIAHQARIPEPILDPLARFFQPHIYGSHKAMKSWLRDGDFDEDDVPEYSEEEIEKAYMNPAFTSKTPLVWLARDEVGTSKHEIGELEGEGLRSSDEGAWIDEHGKLQWSWDDFGQVPIFKGATKW
jgi:calcium permeable stress-gated cation channel